jgi:hypothetical protein
MFIFNDSMDMTNEKLKKIMTQLSKIVDEYCHPPFDKFQRFNGLAGMS